jgi:signal transduction histidine kinase
VSQRPGKEPRTAVVLVVDDSASSRQLASDALSEEGYQVVHAADGEEALAAFGREDPDCVLLDVRMPGQDGFSVCRQIRATEQGAETPVVFLTALRDLETFEEAQRAGADDFITKPINVAEMVLRVQAMIQVRKLRTEVRGHYELLKRQRDDLIRLKLQKERLTAFLVHDLKNPVNSIELNAQLVVRHRDSPEAVKQAGNRIRVGTQQLNQMILNLLDLSLAEEGRLAPKLQTVDLRALLAELEAEFALTAQTHQVSIQTDLQAVHIQADKDLLRRVLANLLENAIRHAPAETVVNVVCKSVQSGVEIQITDKGAGVPAELREKIFEPFVKGEPVKEVRGGRGLGLAFCKLAVQAHGGEIRVEDAAPGSHFCARFPDAA